MTDTGSRGGYNSAICPECGESVVWTFHTDINKTIRCTGTIVSPDRKSRHQCKKKMPRSDWEYLAMQQRKEKRPS